MAKLCAKALVSGKVQGVWFRQSTRQQALANQLTGWANNLADGRVEVMLCGEEENVRTVLSWLQHGPERAQVDQVQSGTLDYRVLESFTTG